MRWVRCLGLTAIVVVAIAGCNDTKASKPFVPPTADRSQAISSGLRDYTIRATDYAYADLPLHAPAGWLTLRLVNAGSESHMLGVLPVPAGYTTVAFTDSVVNGHLPAGLKSQPGVDVVSAGGAGAVTGYFAPGIYLVGCFVKSPDGAYHVLKGMVGSFDVIAYGDSGSAPHADAVVSLRKSRVTLDGSVTAGRRTLRVVTDNPHWADFQILRLRPGRTPSDAVNWYNNRATVAPAADAFGGISSASSGQRAFMTADFTPATYLLLFPAGGTDARPLYAQYVLTVAKQR